MKIKYFTFLEAIRSSIAKKYNINNIPSDFSIINNIIHTAYCMDDVRGFLGYPIKVNSWFRCLKLNRHPKINSKDTSQHPKGQAVDFVCKKFGTVREVYEAIKHSEIEFDQLILEPNEVWIHISFKLSGNRRQYLDKS